MTAAAEPMMDAPVHVDPRARAEILFAILLAMFLSALDQTIVGTALPTIMTQLHGNDLYTWVVTIYLLTATISGPIYGKLSDQFGRRPMVMIGVSLFLIGSALSGLSQEAWQLIAARGLQGLGAGAIFPIALAVIGDLFTPAERGKYQGLFGAVFGISALIGPALGGFLTDNVGWHWIFFVNLPIGAVALVIIWRLLPPIKHPERARSIDYLGSAVFAAALVPILIGLTNKQTMDWANPEVGGLILLGLALSAVFVWVESRAAEPILPLSLFRNRSISVSLIAVSPGGIRLLQGRSSPGPHWFQVVLGSSATESGYQIPAALAGLIITLRCLGTDHRPDRPLPLDHHRRRGASRSRRLFLMTGALRDHRLPQMWCLDESFLAQHRPDPRGLHDRDPNAEPFAPARRTGALTSLPARSA